MGTRPGAHLPSTHLPNYPSTFYHHLTSGTPSRAHNPLTSPELSVVDVCPHYCCCCHCGWHRFVCLQDGTEKNICLEISLKKTNSYVNMIIFVRINWIQDFRYSERFNWASEIKRIVAYFWTPQKCSKLISNT